ncbi:MAG TPA: HDIG domain-containing metalloprotein [Bacteroidales bacterium]
MNSLLSKLQHNYYDLLKVIFFILAIGIIVWASPKTNYFRYEFQVGKPWNHKDMIASFDFSIKKTDKQLSDEREEILKTFIPYFKYDENITAAGAKQLKANFAESWRLKYRNQRKADSLRYSTFLNKLFLEIEQEGIIQTNPSIEGKESNFPIYFIKGNEVSQTTLGQIFNIRSANKFANTQIRRLQTSDTTLLKQVLSQSLVQNVLYDEDNNLKEIEEIVSKISPSTGLVQKGELIISTGEVVSPDKYQRLLSLKQEYEQDLNTTFSKKLILAGMILLISLLFLIEYLYLVLFRRKVYQLLKNIILILFSQLTLIVLSFFFFLNYPQWTLVIPFAILPIIIAAFYDSGIAIIIHLITVMVLGFYAPNSFEFFYTEFAAGLVAIFAVRKLAKRSDIFLSAVFVFVTYMMVYVSMLLIQEGSLDNFSRTQVAYMAVSSILLLLAYPIILLYEKVFGVITQITLLEISNTNNPLLRELSMKAPGTFQHSLQVANLASEALYAIGGDSLLARTGALYHDIGKMNNPLFFVENQVSEYNPHDNLSSEESARIIIGHVLDGIEMARKAGLPEQIIDFIRTHHGDRRVEYFYRLERKMHPGMEVDQSEFTYHGPIPFSRETAVVMMADSVEAASRSISKLDEQKINDLVDNIVASQLNEGQFLNSDITMKDINIVKKVLKKKLLNIHHARIAYPD